MSTAASPAEPRPFGGRILRSPALRSPASHDGSGIRFVFRAPAGRGCTFALDVEAKTPPPDVLLGLLGPEALRHWTEIEVVAKLLRQPAHLVLKGVLAEGRAAPTLPPGIELCRSDTPTHWIAVGRMRSKIHD